MENWKTKFVLLSVGQAVSMLTSSILQISIVWYLTQQTGSAAVVTTSTLSGYLPRAVLGMFTGVFIDGLTGRRFSFCPIFPSPLPPWLWLPRPFGRKSPYG